MENTEQKYIDYCDGILKDIQKQLGIPNSIMDYYNSQESMGSEYVRIFNLKLNNLRSKLTPAIIDTYIKLRKKGL